MANNTIAALYTQRMVPLGQMIDLLHLLVDQANVRYKFAVAINRQRVPRDAKYVTTALTGPILDTLHLLNLAVQAGISRQDRIDIEQLTAELDDLINLLRTVLRDWSSLAMKDPDLGSAMHMVLIHPRDVRPGLEPMQKFMEAMAKQIEPVSRILAHIWAEIGYLPTERAAWLQARLSDAKRQPLAQNGKASYWLTLVRNMPLDRVLAMLDVRLNKHYLDCTSIEGRQRLPQLLASLPGYLSVANKEELVGPNTTRIPEDVSVTVKDGLLVLRRELPSLLNPVAQAEPKEWADFCTRHTVTLPSAEERSLEVVCGVETLGKGLLFLAQAKNHLEATALRIKTQFEKDKAAVRQSALVERLTANLNEEEMQALAAHFANKS